MRASLRLGVLLGLLLIGAFAVFVLVRDRTPAPRAVERVELAVPLHPTSILVFIALDQGYFSAHGLDVTVKNFATGKLALEQGLFGGEADFAWSTDAPVAFAGFERSDFRIIAIGLWADNINRVIARRDRGIAAPADLRGKRVATQRGSAVHFFLHLFLLQHGLSEKDIDLSFLKAQDLPGALIAGRIDAFSMREPFVSEAQEALGRNVVIFAAPGLYEQVEVLVARKELLDQHPAAARNVLKGLVDAEKFFLERPREAAGIAARHLKVEAASIEALLPSFRPQVGLSQSWLTLMESEARWAIRTGLVRQQEIPNYLDVIDTRPLSDVRPEAVTIRP